MLAAEGPRLFVHGPLRQDGGTAVAHHGHGGRVAVGVCGLACDAAEEGEEEEERERVRSAGHNNKGRHFLVGSSCTTRSDKARG